MLSEEQDARADKHDCSHGQQQAHRAGRKLDLLAEQVGALSLS